MVNIRLSVWLVIVQVILLIVLDTMLLAQSETEYKAPNDDQNIAGGNKRVIPFAGRCWVVRSEYGKPGPNYWSTSEQSVWVDGNARLHLKIRQEGGTWKCAEVRTQAFSQYGMHRFYVIKDDPWLDNLDKNVVVGLFLYKDNQNEVDIEFAKWGWENPDNAWYVVHPSGNPGNVESFAMELNGTYTTHYIDWHSSWIRFKSMHGHFPEPPDPGYLIHEWEYPGNDIPPQEENLRIHINLWLYDANNDGQGDPPSDGQEVEIIIADADLPPPFGEIECTKGDVNCDGQINVLDVVLVVRFILGLDESSPEQFCAADCNDDGFLNVLDAVGILRVIIGAGTCPP